MLLMSLKTQKNTSDLFVKFIKVSKVPYTFSSLKERFYKKVSTQHSVIVKKVKTEAEPA